MSPNKKMLAAALLLACWFGLVLAGQASAPDFVAVLRDCLVGLGVFTAALVSPGAANPPKE